jgi:hypothetical protein
MSIQENQILDVIAEHNFGMSDYQIQNYVIKSQVTNYNQVKQSLIELNARRDSILQIEVDQKRRLVKKKKTQRQLENETDVFEKELLEIDLEEIEKDLEYAKKRLVVQKREYDLFLNKITTQFESKEQLESFIQNPEEERKYWIARMGKQAAMDLLSTGRIGVGNMDSISMMCEEDQIQTIKVAIQYSSLMSVGMNKIQEEMHPYIKKLAEKSDKILPTFEGIEENLNISLVEKLSYGKKSIQSSNQSEDL